MSPQEINHGKIEEIIHISNSLKCFSLNVTYSPAHWYRHRQISKNRSTSCPKNDQGAGNKLSNSLGQKHCALINICETCCDRLVSCKYQSIVPKIDQFTLKQRRFLLKHTNSKMTRKIFRLKSGLNLLPAHKSRYDLATLSNFVTCETPFNEYYLLFECKNLQL